MIKVFESFNFIEVGQARSLLESEGIETHLRNEFGSSVMGEIPFLEVCPQLYILDPANEERARELLVGFESGTARAEWTCPGCDATVDGPFGQCWSCGQLKPA